MGERICSTAVATEWIDYNGHLRDAYYGLIVSLACDALMDRLGLDAGYRERTGNTLYTVEMHVHFLREVKQSHIVCVDVRLLGADQKRLHVAFDLTRESDGVAAASSELMLLHVHQEGETVTTVPFPPDVAGAISRLAASTASAAEVGPGSRRIELRRR
ncbi:MAG TPA: thioesterase family protein [Steroidobacteraceae bacterium]